MKTKLITILLIFVFSGCVSTAKDRHWKNDTTPSMQPYQIKAVKYERKDDLQLALANWRIAEKLLIAKINAITSHIENSAEMHFQKGVTLYNTGFKEQAKIEFLKALRYDREHTEALSYLRNWYKTSNTIEYTVKPGDTYRTIANKIYHNYHNDYIVRYFSNHTKNKILKAGDVLKLPVLNVELTKKFFNYRKEIQEARKLYHRKHYEPLLIVAENILKHAPTNNEAKFMINTACYKLGEKCFQAGEYKNALEFYKRVDTGFRSVKKNIARVNSAYNKKKNETTKYENEKCYYKGMKLYRKKKFSEALKYLDQVKSGYEDVDEVKLKIDAAIKKKAEIHYKNGVKYFVNENLDRAIKEWKKALALNPEKKVIERDIENAMNLLEKIKQIE